MTRIILPLALFLAGCSGPPPVDKPEAADNQRFEEMDRLLDEAPTANHDEGSARPG